MRRILVLAMYIIMIVAGAAIAWWFLGHGGHRIVGVLGGFLFLFGGYLLWMDFLNPNRKPL